jgi:hypothetical protein
MLEEMNSMTTITSIQKLAIYFRYETSADQWAIISENGWVTLATAAGLTAQDGQAIAQLAGNSVPVTARWQQFSKVLGKNADYLGRMVNDKLEIQVNSLGERFSDVLRRIATEAVEDSP